MRMSAVLVVALAVSVSAAPALTLDGVWGNPQGCAYARTQDIDGDSFVVLRADGFDSYGTGCEWVETLAAKGGAQVVTGLCGYEGEATRGVERFIIVRDAADAGLIHMLAANGERWAELRKCP